MGALMIAESMELEAKRGKFGVVRDGYWGIVSKRAMCVVGICGIQGIILPRGKKRLRCVASLPPLAPPPYTDLPGREESKRCPAQKSKG